MPLFELRLDFQPAFHRACSVCISGDREGEACVQAPRIGVLPKVTHTLPVGAPALAHLHAACVNMTTHWDADGSRCGRDGIRVSGAFESTSTSTALDDATFSLWSPEPGSPPHAMLAAALDCLPPERCAGPAGEMLDAVRSYLRLEPLVTVFQEAPVRLRIAASFEPRSVHAIRSLRSHLDSMPREEALIVDMKALQQPFSRPAWLEAFKPLLHREVPVRWQVSERLRDVIIQLGVDPQFVECASPVEVSPQGLPVILGELLVTDELLQVARNGNRKELIRALREHTRMPVSLAAKGAAELMALLAAMG